jgi:hypothetical protein
MRSLFSRGDALEKLYIERVPINQLSPIKQPSSFPSLNHRRSKKMHVCKSKGLAGTRKVKGKGGCFELGLSFVAARSSLQQCGPVAPMHCTIGKKVRTEQTH